MEEILNVGKIWLFAGIFFIVCVLVILAILLDLWDGVHTAKKTGQQVHSHKLRVTITKMSEYFRFIAIGFLVDCLGYFFSFYILPFMVIMFGLGLMAVEVISMFEHAKRRKSHTSCLPDLVKAIVECAHDKDAHRIVEEITHYATLNNKSV